MVFFFTSQNPDAIIYMGKDKYENEDLIKYALPEDIWFHVDDLSSAHVYLRLKNSDFHNIPKEVLIECSQLVKANSIEGSKKKGVNIVYTPAPNLLKTKDMDTGQVGFKNPSLVKKMHIERDKEIVKVIEKSREEKFPDLEKLYDDRLKEESKKEKEEHKKKEAEDNLKKKQEKEEQKFYKDFQSRGEMKVSNQENPGNDDDFW